MNRIIKYGLYGVGALVLLLAAVVAYMATMFDPNAFKAEIVKAVQASTQRTLTMDGEIKLLIFPKLGASLGKMSISERQSDKEFAAIDSAQVALAFMPLLHGEAVVDEVRVTGLKAVLVKRTAGASNIDDLLVAPKSDKGPARDAKVKFDIAGVRFEQAQLTYREEVSGAEYALQDFNLTTGRIMNGVPSQIECATRIQATKPKMDLTVQLKTALTFDLDKKRYQLAGLDAQVKGEVLDIGNLTVRASGDAGADLSTQEFNAKGLSVVVSGVKAKDAFEATLGAPRIDATKDAFAGDSLQLSVKLNGTNTITATLSLPKIAGTSQTFTSDALLLSMNATGDSLSNKSVSSELKGRVSVDKGKQQVDLDLAGGLLQSQIKAQVGVTDFAKPAIRFQAEVDQFDADLYMPKKAKAGVDGKPAPPPGPEKPFDLSALKTLNLEGSLRLGVLKAANVKAEQINLEIKAHQGVVRVSPLAASLYQGGMKGGVTVDASQALPSFAITQNLDGIDVAPLLKDVADFDTLEGKGSVAVDVTTRGNTVSALKKGLNGKLALNLTDGAIKGINIAKKLREAGNLLGQQSQTAAADKSEKTDFSELKATFTVTEGVAHNEDLSLKSPLVRMTGNGDINIGDSSINYLTKAALVKSLEGQGGQDKVAGLTVPVRASGPFSAIKYTLDFASLAAEVAKQTMESKKQEIKTQVQDKLPTSLKGLFR